MTAFITAAGIVVGAAGIVMIGVLIMFWALLKSIERGK